MYEYGAILALATPTASAAAGPALESATKQQPATRRGRRSQPAKLVTAISTAATPGTVLGAIQATRELAKRIGSKDLPAERRAADFSAQLGAVAPAFLKPIGYEGTSRSICWIEALYALGVLSEPAQRDAPQIGAGDVVLAARALEAFFQDVAQVALALAAQAPNAIIRFADLSKAMSPPIPHSMPEERDSLRTLVNLPHRHHIAHTRYFCLSARSLGLLRFSEVVRVTSIRVTLPTMAESRTPDATPSLDAPDERGHDAIEGRGDGTVSE